VGTLKSNLYNCKACDKSCNINKEKLCAKGGKSFNFFFFEGLEYVFVLNVYCQII
jgi:hypothetical protein